MNNNPSVMLRSTSSARIDYMGMFPHFRCRKARRSSFENSIFDEYTIEKCVKSGFFSLRNEDDIMCFACGCKFSSWLNCGCDPLQLHLEYAPSCDFIQLYNSNPSCLEEIDEIVAVKAVVDLGYDPDLVTVVYETLEKNLKTPPNSTDILEVIWKLDGKVMDPVSFHCETCRELDPDSFKDNTDVQIHISQLLEREKLCKRLRQRLDYLMKITMCRTCKTAKANMLNLPCGHLANCNDCVYQHNRCVTCHSIVKGIVEVFL